MQFVNWQTQLLVAVAVASFFFCTSVAAAAKAPQQCLRWQQAVDSSVSVGKGQLQSL